MAEAFYDFARQFKHGQRGEEVLDAFFGARYNILPATAADERRGIDRYFTDVTGRQLTVQYKTDTTAATTGNVFVEVVSVDTHGKPGWVFSCRADWLVYYVPGWRTAFAVIPDNLRAALPKWYETCTLRPVRNKSYHTIGLLVPRLVFGAACQQVIDLDGE
ncbi:MAG TPA: hypothetical protein PKA95_08445 [Thermomicrobiales bacterium]|nr:hypothetical protein [Thermomicrobiales bacterium]